MMRSPLDEIVRLLRSLTYRQQLVGVGGAAHLLNTSTDKVRELVAAGLLGHEPDPAKRRRLRQGEAIRKVRELRSMSIGDLAAAVSVTNGAVSQWETGRFTPRLEMQVRIARALDMPHSALFGVDAEVFS